MSLYTRALKYIDMDRVKELREENIKKQKITEIKRQEEIISAELKKIYAEQTKHYNWRRKLGEGMTSSGMFNTTLPATGDVDLVSVEVSNADTWISSSGGTTVSGSGLNFDQRPSNIYSTTWTLANFTTEFDATQVDNLKVTVTTGTGVDTPFADNPLTIEWVSDTDLGTLGTFSAGGGTKVFTLPKEANVKNLFLYYSVSGNGTSYRTYTDGYLVGQSIYGGAMDSDMSQQGMTILSAGATPNTSPSYPTVDDVKALYGFTFWTDALTESRVTALRNGSISGPMPPSWGGNVPPGQVSGGFTRQDQIDIYNQIHNLYASYDTRASNLYSVNATSFQRRTPMNVFVSLDSPEATSFIRTDSSMQGLSAEDRKKKLMDMLDSGNEYLLKTTGIIGSSAKPSDTTMPDSWEQVSNNGVKDYGNIAQSDNVDRQIDNMLLRGLERGDYGTGPNIQKQIDNLKRNLRNKTPGGSFLPLAGGRNTMDVAHYKPEGEVLSEKKKLKSVKDVTSKIPGYYDGKPAPLGFPMQEPPKMKNGFHPDLVTPEGQKKQSNRYNNLDPQSAKAMPPTGNPYIDKKVRAAAKNPK